MDDSMMKKRRTQAERRERSLGRILDVATDILSSEGYANFSASRVATRAGLSRGALEHYFPKRLDLVAATCQHAMDQAAEETRNFALGPDLDNDPVGTFMAASEQFFFAPAYGTQIEIQIAARADPELAERVFPIIAEARRTMDGIWTETLTRSGYARDKAARFIELSHYLLRGMFVVQNWLPYEMDRAAILEEWRNLAPTALRGAVSEP